MLDTSDVQSVNARVVDESTIEIQCMDQMLWNERWYWSVTIFKY